MKKLVLALLPVLLSVVNAFADPILIKNFTIKENPFGKDEIAVVATDTAGVIQENVNGTFKFTINGFDEDLNFEKWNGLLPAKAGKIELYIFAAYERRRFEQYFILCISPGYQVNAHTYQLDSVDCDTMPVDTVRLPVQKIYHHSGHPVLHLPVF